MKNGLITLLQRVLRGGIDNIDISILETMNVLVTNGHSKDIMNLLKDNQITNTVACCLVLEYDRIKVTVWKIFADIAR